MSLLALWLAAVQPAATEPAYDAITDVARVFGALMKDHLHGDVPKNIARRAIDAMIADLDPWSRRIEPEANVGQAQGIRCLEDRGVVRLKIPRFDGTWAGRWLKKCPALNKNLPILIDLRGNPGGSVADALALADLFIKGGDLLVEERRDQATHIHRARPTQTRFAGLVLLVDQNTASAAEMLAAVLKLRAKAHVAGATTMGKSTVQTALHLNTGGYILLTTGRLKLPNGAEIHGVGLRPDGAVPKDPVRYACGQAGFNWLQGRCVQRD
jgi:C-terminal peptidase prc